MPSPIDAITKPNKPKPNEPISFIRQIQVIRMDQSLGNDQYHFDEINENKIQSGNMK